jgi:IS1 family transposase
VSVKWGTPQSYVGKKQAHINKGEKKYSIGDQWTFVAIDRDTKLVPNYLVGKRTGKNTKKFLYSTSARMANRVQISSDALPHYVYAVDAAFGSDVDYGRIVKTYKAEPHGSGKYSPSQVISVNKKIIRGNPDLDLISTSHVERQNLTMRMSMRRFTRLTNAFSKKLKNMKAAVALHFAHYNFVRIHSSLKVTPAMEAGVVNDLWSIYDLIRVAERYG